MVAATQVRLLSRLTSSFPEDLVPEWIKKVRMYALVDTGEEWIGLDIFAKASIE